MEIYSLRGDEIFVQHTSDATTECVLYVVFAAVFGLAGYWLGVQWYDKPEDKKELEAIKTKARDQLMGNLGEQFGQSTVDNNTPLNQD